jgi:hypothetical protein
LLVSAGALVVSMVLASRGVVPAWWLLINAAVVGGAVLFERSAYRPTVENPNALEPTGERFQDPTTGELIEVWEDPRTGAREYRPVAPG